MFIEGSLLANYFILGMCFLVLASFLAGYIDSIAGGAGLVLIPAFIVAGFPPQLALGQEKLVSTIGTLAAIRNFMRSKSIIWKVVPLGVVTALIGSYIGAKLILILPSEILTTLILCLLPIGLIFTLFKSKFVKDSTNRKNGEFLQSTFLLLAVCLVVGFYDGFFGPGTGSLFIVALFLINKFTLLNASATSKIFNFSSNIGAFVAFLIAGKMAFLIGIPMIIANFIGNHIGSQHAISTNGNVVKKVLVLTVVLLMGTLIFQIK